MNFISRTLYKIQISFNDQDKSKINILFSLNNKFDITIRNIFYKFFTKFEKTSETNAKFGLNFQ